MSLRISNSCTRPPFFSMSFFTMKLPMASLVYDWFALVLITTPPLIFGVWFSSWRDE